MSHGGPWQIAKEARAQIAEAEVAKAADAIEAHMGRVRLAQTKSSPSDGVRARRDMHARHQGLLQARFVVASDLGSTEQRLGVTLQHGVFRAGASYDCFLRYSSGSKYVRSDEIPDGRGLGLKLIADAIPAGENPLGQAAGPGLVQDFVLLNGPAFFARDAEEMVGISALEAEDLFSLSHFLRNRNLPGLRAALHMLESQATSPLDLDYFSQTPYALGDLVVKYRVRRISPRTVLPTDPYQGPNKLFLALRDELHPTSNAARSAVVLEFAVQLAPADQVAFPIDDATVVWDETVSSFIPIARLTIAPQAFDTSRRMDAAERLTFDPWCGLQSHEPLGSINVARRKAYESGAAYRSKLNQVPPVDPGKLFTQLAGSGTDTRALPPGGGRLVKDSTNRSLVSAVGLAPRLGRWLYARALEPWAYLVPLVLAAGFLVRAFFSNPEDPIILDFTKALPSEALIPPATFNERYQDPERRAAVEKDPRYIFRYAPTGSEYDAGIPYWIYRALPRIAPQYFAPTGDWRSVGLDVLDDQQYYESYHELPRGFVLSDTLVHILGSDVKVAMKRVSFNCATCHRGEFEHQNGDLEFIDGMPNQVLDAVAFKLAVYQSFRHADFNPVNVIAKVNEVIAEERHRAKQRGLDGPDRLTALEEVVYTALVQETKRRAGLKPIHWIKERPENGPGRVDAFGAIRFEFLGHDPALDHAVTTVDLPSIWNQGRDFRTTHHWDGNTSDVRGRNFGAILGVGGQPLSVHRRDVAVVGGWIDDGLRAPKFPEPERVQGDVARGREIFEQNCAACHGTYGEKGQLLTRPACMDTPLSGDGTDPERVRAMTPEFIREFNAFGQTAGLWDPNAFESRAGYLCPPLDAIWARAPYLHNGSVPTLDDLLLTPSSRPKSFFRGTSRYDSARGGFDSRKPAAAARSFEYVTQQGDPTQVGNSAAGHDHPILEPDDRRDLIAYLLLAL